MLIPDYTVLVEIMSRAGVGLHLVLPLIDYEVIKGNPDLLTQLREYAKHHGEHLSLIEPPLMVRGGEISKSDPKEVDEFYQRTQTDRIDRHSFAQIGRAHV